MAISSLGKGLDALFIDNAGPDSGPVSELPLSEIEPDRSQPRQTWDDDSLEELANSIAEHGVLSPILVRPLPAGRRAHEQADRLRGVGGALRLGARLQLQGQARDDERQHAKSHEVSPEWFLEAERIPALAPGRVPPGRSRMLGPADWPADLGTSEAPPAARVGKVAGCMTARS